jgi:hypothetical protein
VDKSADGEFQPIPLIWRKPLLRSEFAHQLIGRCAKNEDFWNRHGLLTCHHHESENGNLTVITDADFL